MFPPGLIESFGLYLVRTSALVLFTPLLGTGARFSGYKIATIAVVALVLFAADGSPLPAYGGPAGYGLLCLREVLVGLFLAFAVQLTVLIVHVAGEMIGQEMGFNMAGIVDPETGIRTPLVTRMYEIFLFLAFLAVDGHHWVLRSLELSFRQAPVGRLTFGDGAFDYLTALLAESFRAGLTFAAPVMVLLFLVSLLIGLLARLVPQINVLEVGFTLRIGVALLALLLFAPFLAPALESTLDLMARALETAPVVVGG